MGLRINEMEYNTLYKIMDQKEGDYTTGTWYVSKVEVDESIKKKYPKETFIMVFNFDLNERIIKFIFGYINLIKYQRGTEFTVIGYVIDKDHYDFDNVEIKDMLFSTERFEIVKEEESTLLKSVAIDEFFDDPEGYFKRTAELGSK